MQHIKKTYVLVTLAFVIAIITSFLLGRSGIKNTSEHAHTATVTATGETIWTCSMHPQIKLPKKGKCPICFMDLIPLEIPTSPHTTSQSLTLTESAQTLSEITTATVKRKKVFHDVRTVGLVTYDETRVRSITARISGRIEKMYVDFTGIRIAKNKKLFTLYSPELFAAQEEYLQALENNNSMLIESARKKLSLWELSEAQISRLEQTRTASLTLPILSPLSGSVINKHASEGMYIRAGMPIYTIADLSVVWVELDAYETDLPWIRKGLSVTFTTRSAPGKTFKGKVTFIAPVLDPKTRTVKVQVTVRNQSRQLKPGMFVSGIIEASLQQTSKELPLVIPASAPLITGKRALVYIQTQSSPPTYEGRTVALGPRAGDYYTVLSGVTEGEQVVVHGAFKIDAALQIQAKPSMMTPETDAVNAHASSTQNHKISPRFTTSLEPIFTAYFKAQTALANDDLHGSLKQLKRIVTLLGTVKSTLLKGASRAAWDTKDQALRNALQHIEHLTSLQSVRTLFQNVSAPIIEIQKNFGHTGTQNHYIAFCPMAFSNKGGSWLQNHDTIANPYYGAAMLRCGEIKETITGK